MKKKLTIGYVELNRRVAQHFESPDEMRAFFETVYGDPLALSNLHPTTPDRRERIRQFPAVVFAADLLVVHNLILDLHQASRAADGEHVSITMDRHQAHEMWDAYRAVARCVNTIPGPAVIRTLARLMDYDRLGVNVLRVLGVGELDAEIRRGLTSLTDPECN